ncbi:MAG TPA: DUF11 domain-containing protein, partial [Anaerolineae bacterium]|nr:DUF11 domain-containing protein [Anaerolineae bacterium]
LGELWGTDANGGLPGVAVITMVTTVSDTVGAGQLLTNTASIPYYDSQPDGGPGPHTPDQRTYTDGEDSVWHRTPPPYGEKFVDPITATIGDQIVYSLIGPYLDFTLYDVVVTDVVDGRLTVVDSRAIGSGDPPITSAFVGNLVTGTWGSVPPHSYSALIITTTLDDPTGAVAGDRITNTAVFQWSMTPGGPPQPITQINVVTVTVVEPLVGLDKSVDTPRAPLGVGDIVTYSLALSNTGTSPAYDLVITDRLPAGLTFVATEGFAVSDPTTATLGGSYPAWTVSRLNVGGFVYLTFTARVDADVGAGLTLTNAAWGAYSSQPGDHPGERIYRIPTDTVPVRTGYPALDLEKTPPPGPVPAGARLLFTLTVTNTGIVSATSVVITDRVPANTTYEGCGPAPCGEASGVVSWSLGTVDIGVPRVVTLAVRAGSALSQGTVITNTGWLTSGEGLTDTDTVTVPIGVLADLSVVKVDGPDPVPVGDYLTYTLRVVNNGPSLARNVSVTDTLPSEVTFLSATPPPTVGPNPLVWTGLGDLDVGDQMRFTVTVRVNVTTTAPFTNVASTGSDTPDTTPENNQDEETTTPLLPGLELVKRVEPGRAARRMPFTYTLRVTNTGGVTFDPLVITDTLPPDFYYVAGSGSPTDPDLVAGPTLVWQNLGPLAPGAS